MSPAELLEAFKTHGAVLKSPGGDRLCLEAPEDFPEDLKNQARSHKAALIRLLTEPTNQSPREHFLGLAEGFEEGGIVGRLGCIITGDLWQAVHGWELAADGNRSNAQEKARAYWELWERYAQIGAAQ